jgi:hypothetical protein
MSSTSGVEVKAGFFPLAFLLLLCRPHVVIDGGPPQRRSWGTHFFPLAPGRHLVKVYFPYLFKPECGANQREIDVPEGCVVPVRFYMWPWMFAPGSMKVLDPRRALPEARVV